MSLPSCGRSAVVPVIFSRNIFWHPGRLQLPHLTALVLGGGRYPRIAVNHNFFMHQKSASKRPNRIKGGRMMQISSILRANEASARVSTILSNATGTCFNEYNRDSARYP
jgi:hypothetical protein